MLKTRVIPVLLLKDVGLVKGVAFDSQRRVGSVLPAVTVYNSREVDELVLLDVMATHENREPDYALIEEVAAYCFVPFSVGGGIHTVGSIKRLLRCGADKIVLNTVLYQDLSLVRDIARKFGSQCIIASIDVKFFPEEGYCCYSHSGLRPEKKKLEQWVQELESAGVGEILITSIDRDGTLLGYDCDLIRKVSNLVKVPVIAAGGAGSYQHMFEAIEAGASAVAAASIFHFTQATPGEAKGYLHSKGIPVRA